MEQAQTSTTGTESTNQVSPKETQKTQECKSYHPKETVSIFNPFKIKELPDKDVGNDGDVDGLTAGLCMITVDVPESVDEEQAENQSHRRWNGNYGEDHDW